MVLRRATRLEILTQKGESFLSTYLISYLHLCMRGILCNWAFTNFSFGLKSNVICLWSDESELIIELVISKWTRALRNKRIQAKGGSTATKRFIVTDLSYQCI